MSGPGRAKIGHYDHFNKLDYGWNVQRSITLTALLFLRSIRLTALLS